MQHWLPVLAGHLPVPIPAPVAPGRPGCGFGRPWSVLRWVPGETVGRGRVDLDRLADDLAGFLAASSGPRPGGVGPRDLTGSCDLALAWTLFDGSRRTRFRTAVGGDDATWARPAGGRCGRRSRGWPSTPRAPPQRRHPDRVGVAGHRRG